MRKLITINDAAADLLRKPAKRVKNVQATEVILGIQEMKRIATAWEHETGHMCEGLAATQIGWNARVIILRKSDKRAPKKPNPAHYDHHKSYLRAKERYDAFQRNEAGVFDPWHVIINPVILHEEGSQESVEACLSVPGSAYKVYRPEVMFFKYRMPNNKTSKVFVVKGKDAAALQHELDHTKGILLPDHAVEAYVGDDKAPL